MSDVNRREFLRAGAAAIASTMSAQGAKRPNIILIMADDLGYSDIGCYGSEINTPNLDSLAREGLRLTHFYNTARCCPTRAALLTGLYQHQAGIGHMVENRGDPSYQGFLNDKCVTIAEAMRQGGYRTAMSGKWHVGEERPHWPTDRGFERYFGLISGATNYFKIDEGRGMALGDQPYKPPERGFYITDAFTDNALKQIDEFANGSEPYFLYLAYTAPHWPLHAPEEDVARYEGKYMKGWDELRRERHARMMKLGVVDKRWPLTERDASAPAWETVPDKKDRDRKMAVYAAQIDRMDQNIGRVLRKVRDLGQEENTLIIFLADNGGCAEEIDRGEKNARAGTPSSYVSYGLPWANASNTPFRLYKHWVHEGGISSPFIARWPAGIKQRGTITPQPAHLIDIMATCLGVAGIEYPKTYNGKQVTPLEGKSLQPILEGKQRRGHDAIYWEHEGNRAVRQGNWKLVSRYRGAWELYDLEADRTELHNLAPSRSGRVQRMSAMYNAWAARAGVIPWSELQKPRPPKPA
jgi:arylsulfatase A-like enzyme